MTMSHEAQLWRGEDNLRNQHCRGFAKASEQIDKWIQEIHTGIHGIGKFELFLYELSPEGHHERCISEFQPVLVAVRC